MEKRSISALHESKEKGLRTFIVRVLPCEKGRLRGEGEVREVESFLILSFCSDVAWSLLLVVDVANEILFLMDACAQVRACVRARCVKARANRRLGLGLSLNQYD